MDEMLVMACGVIKAKTLCKEAIKVRTSAPSATHCDGLHGSGILGNLQAPNLQPQIGRRDLNYPLVTCIQVGEPHINYRWTLGTLQMMSSDSSWRTSAERSLLGNLMHPKRSTTDPLGNQWEIGIPMWMTRRSSFWEGEGGNPQDNHFNPLLPLNQMEGGNPKDNHLDPLPPLKLMKMWDTL